MLVKSVSYDQFEIIHWILKLHCKGNIELDATYGRGNFYKKGIEKPTHKFDLFPRDLEIEKADARKLPIVDNSINTIMFDPPFLATKGASLSVVNDSNKISRRFGVYPTEKELFGFYKLALKEFYRVLVDDGVLIFKCQDKISSGKQYLSHVFIINEAEKLGYYCKDLFILLSKHRMVADWQLKGQKNARKFHSYFLVFEKNNKKIEYL